MPTDTKERAADRAAKHAKKAVELAQLARESEAADSPDETMAGDIRDILRSLPAEADLRLYRKSTKTGKLEYCESFAEPSSFSEEYVAQKWGAGSYRIMAKVPDQKTGKMQFVEGGTKTFTIAERPAGVIAPVADKSGQLDTMTLMHQMMLQSQESHRAMIAMMMQSMTQRPVDGSLELMKVILPSLLAKKDADPFEMATRLAELLKPAGPAASMADQLDALGKMMEVAERLGGGKSDGPAWLEALKTAAPLLTQALQTPRPVAPVAPAATGGPPTPKAIAAPAPPVAANPPVVEAPEPEPEPAHPLLALLDYAMPSLVRAAERDGEPELYADWLVDQIPEDQLDAFGSFVEQTSVLDQLATRYPATVPHRGWFERLAKAILDGLEPDDESGAASEPESHDDENH